jgi:hypothetical protein
VTTKRWPPAVLALMALIGAGCANGSATDTGSATSATNREKG